MSIGFTLKSLREASTPNKLYRLDIVKGVSFLEEGSDPKTPFKTLLVNFSEYKYEYQNLEKIKALLPKEVFKNFYTTKTITIKTNITDQIFLVPGSVWKNGRMVWQPSENISISLNTGSEKPLIRTLSQIKKELGISMPYIEGGYSTAFLVLHEACVKGVPKTVLIPTSEIIRYYFSGSTYLTHQIYNGGLEGLRRGQRATGLFFRYSFNLNDKTAYIWLNRKCYDSDAVILARGLTNNTAMSAMKYVYSSLSHAKNHFDPQPSSSSPFSFLPFTGSSNMEVWGQWCSIKGTNDTAFIVRTIVSCDHPLPFEKILIESVDSYRGKNKEEGSSLDDSREGGTVRKKLKPHEQNEVELTQGEAPSAEISPQELEFYLERFTPLQSVEIEKVKKVSDKEKQSVFSEEAETENAKGSTLPGDYSSQEGKAQPWEVQPTSAESIPLNERIKNVSRIVSEMENNSQELCVTALPVGHIDNTTPYGLYEFEKPRGKSEHYSWNIIYSYDQSTYRKRKALMLKIKNEKTGNSAYLLEIEGKGKASYSLFLATQYKTQNGNTDLTTDEATELLGKLAFDSGKRVVQKIEKFFVAIFTLKHISSENDSFDEKVKRSIKQALLMDSTQECEDTNA